MTVCNRCGKENQDHYKFCLGCGAELTAPKAAGGDVAMMKTMMADPSQQALPGAPLRGPSAQMPQPNRGMPGMPPSGPLGAGPGPGWVPGLDPAWAQARWVLGLDPAWAQARWVPDRSPWGRRLACLDSLPDSRRHSRPPPRCGVARRAAAMSRRRSGSAARAAFAWTRAPRRNSCRSRRSRAHR